MRQITAKGMMLITCAALQAGAAQQIEAKVVVEIPFRAEKAYTNPFHEVTMDVVFTDPEGAEKTVPAFWAGGNEWKVRYASPVVGTHSYRSICGDSDDAGLHAIEGRIDIKPYTGNNPLYRHGPIQVSKNRRYFEHADGTPFLWLGDTWWKGLCKRLPWEGFKELTANRKAKGFNVVQIVCGPYPDEPDHDPRLANEGGMPYDKGYNRINPEYFDYADRRIEHLVEEGLMPVIFGAWGYHIRTVGVEKMNRHWRYLIARYGAYPVAWSVVGEVFKGGNRWIDVAEYVRKADPYHRTATIHSQWARGHMPDAVLDFDMMMPGQGGGFGEKPPLGDWGRTPLRTTAIVQAAYAKTPPMPLVIGEICYEDHMMTNGAELQRQVFWSSLLLGVRGFTYGAEGLWQMNSETERGAEYAFTPWFEAMHYKGSTQLGMGKKLLQAYPWWRFEPHPEWVVPHATILTDQGRTSDHRTVQKAFEALNGRWDLPYAAGIPGEVRIIYIPGHYYDWTAPTVKGLERDVPYHAFLFDPVRAKRYELGLIVNNGSAKADAQQMKKLKALAASVEKGLSLVMHANPGILPAIKLPEVTILPNGNYKLPRLPAPQDWILVLERIKE
jgi:hypothetical protein